MTSRVQHGTRSGYVYHYTVWKTPVCDDCRTAHRDATKEITEAQNAARGRLQRIFHNEYQALLNEEKFKRGL